MILSAVRPLSSLPVRTVPGDADLRKGLAALPRGSICEILGASSTGRTSIAQAMIATATLGGEITAVIDAFDSFDPASARKAGADLGKLLWVKCNHRPEKALKAADMILHSGGFGLVLFDLCDVSPAVLSRVPLTWWYRFRSAVENTPSVLLILSQQSVARSCAARQFELRQNEVEWQGMPPFQIIRRFGMAASSRKPPLSEPVKMAALAEA